MVKLCHFRARDYHASHHRNKVQKVEIRNIFGTVELLNTCMHYYLLTCPFYSLRFDHFGIWNCNGGATWKGTLFFRTSFQDGVCLDSPRYMFYMDFLLSTVYCKVLIGN